MMKMQNSVKAAGRSFNLITMFKIHSPRRCLCYYGMFHLHSIVIHTLLMSHHSAIAHHPSEQSPHAAARRVVAWSKRALGTYYWSSYCGGCH